MGGRSPKEVEEGPEVECVVGGFPEAAYPEAAYPEEAYPEEAYPVVGIDPFGLEEVEEGIDPFDLEEVVEEIDLAAPRFAEYPSLSVAILREVFGRLNPCSCHVVGGLLLRIQHRNYDRLKLLVHSGQLRSGW